MNQTALSLLVGLIGGLSGGDTLARRLERIEAMLEDRPEPRILNGRAEAPSRAGAMPSTSTVKIELDEALLAALDARVRAAVKESVSESFESMDAASVEYDESPKKMMTLAEVAAEIDLSADEEEAIRRIHRETMDEMLKLMAGEDETAEDVRRELEQAKDDPAKSAALSGKYMGRAMTNLGGFIGVMMSHEQKLNTAIGAEKATRLDAYDVTDLDPYGIEALFDGMGG